MRLAQGLAVALVLSGCGDNRAAPDAGPDPARDPAAVRDRLATTLDDLAALGAKRAGTPGGMRAGELVRDRFVAAGLADVHFESFDFPAFALASHDLAVTVDGAPSPMDSDVFAYSGAGSASAAVVYVGTGHEQAYAGVDVTGKIVLVTRDPKFHRSSQYRLIVAHGGAAMLYISQAPANLIQVGTVSALEAGLGPVPALTIGADDGAALVDALTAGRAVHADIAVDAAIEPATGRNVIGRLPGSEPSGAYLLVGAHYDTWQTGSIDNSTGTSALIELAETLAHAPGRRLGLVFVAYDGEELGLLGGYDYLRDHVVVAGEQMLGFFNLEMPASGVEDVRALARTSQPALGEALERANLRGLFPFYVGLQVVPQLFGGIIPTDIQGMYWSGLAGMTTACDTPYYHTDGDTPDKVDTDFLAHATLAVEDALTDLDDEPLASLTARDPAVWRLAVSRQPSDQGQDLDVLVTDADGAAQADAHVTVDVDVDDFSQSFSTSLVSDADGHARVTVPTAALAAGSGSRWLHVLAGPTYPLAEAIQPLP